MSSGRRRDWRTIYLAPNGTQLFQDVDWYAGDVDDLVTHKHMHIESINSCLAHVHTRTHTVCVCVCVCDCVYIDGYVSPNFRLDTTFRWTYNLECMYRNVTGQRSL